MHPSARTADRGTALVFELGGRALDEQGRRIAPVDIVLETDLRKPAEKHAILEMYVRHGVGFHRQIFVSRPAMRLIAERGGRF